MAMRFRSLLFPAFALLAFPLACGDRTPAKTAKTATSASATETAAPAGPTGPKADTVTAETPPPPPPGESSKLLGSARQSYDAGVLSYNAGDLPGASKHFRDAVSAEPKAYEAYYALGVTSERMGKTADALEAYRNAYKLNPNFDAAIAAYGFLLYKQGSKTEAEAFLSDQSAKNPKALGVMTALAEIKSLQGDSNSAQTLAGNVLVQEAKYEPAMILIARDHYRRGRNDLATYVLSAILDGQKTQEEKEKGLPAKASPPRAPNNAEAHLLRAVILQKQNERLAAAKWFETAAKLRPDLVDAQLQLGLIRLEANDAQGALEPLKKAVSYSGGNVEAHLALGDAYRLSGGQGPNAKTQYQWVISATGAPAQLKALAQYNMGLLYFLTPGMDSLNDVTRYDRAVEYWKMYKTAKGTTNAPSWPADADELIEQAQRARQAAAAGGTGAGGTAPKPAPTPAKPATSAAPAATPAKSAAPAPTPTPAASAPKPAPTASAPKPASSGGVKTTF
jgi:Tfp pilus assembly protein PilF